jgi:monofunctional biosynthetic peptidoglycan transglycosylase
MKIFKAIIAIFLLLIISLASLYFFNDASKLKNGYTVYNKKNKDYEVVTKKPSHWVKLNQVSKKALWAIIVSEDWAFYDHNGVDMFQVKEAIEDSVTQGDKIRGASTITQQVVKNALYSNKRSFIRKFKELIAAFKLESELTKDEILEQYINLIELGDGIYGIKEGARFYFNKLPKDLSAKEGAFLAMLLPSPKKYSISFRNRKLTDYAKKIIDRILVKLRQAKIIDEDQRYSEANKYLSFEDNKIIESYF